MGSVGTVVVVVENSLGDALKRMARCMVGEVGNGRILIGFIASLEGSAPEFGDDFVLQLTPSIGLAFKFLVVGSFYQADNLLRTGFTDDPVGQFRCPVSNPFSALAASDVLRANSRSPPT